MLTIFSEDHLAHQGGGEFHRGRIVPCFETPKRVEIIHRAIQEAQLGEIKPPTDFGLEPILHVHDSNYVDFIQTIYPQWEQLHPGTDALPHAWCVRRMNQRCPENIYGQLGYYSSDAGTPITAGTWQAALTAAHSSLTAQKHIQSGERSAFALTRPPGHHASFDFFGGYCFLNNAAIAAQAFLDQGASRVAILDVDYHHGNGTQDLFWDRDDVLVLSIHADPSEAYPYFLGYEEEKGIGAGEGFTCNYPMPEGTAWKQYSVQLDQALQKIDDSAVDYLVVALGVDTFKGDPLSNFSLLRSDFSEMGQMIARLNKPTLFVMEGGYAVEQVGENVVEVLTGFEGE